MTAVQGFIPSRLAEIAGTLGVGTHASVAGAPAASARLGEPTIPTTPTPGTKYYLGIDAIPGSVADVGFAGQIALLTWGWGTQSSTAPARSGTGGGVGRATPQDVIFAARTGIHSPKLVHALNEGLTLASALISCVRPGPTPLTFLTIKFDTVAVTDYYVTPNPADANLVDVVHLRCLKVTDKVFVHNPDGSAGTPISTSFDYSTNAGS